MIDHLGSLKKYVPFLSPAIKKTWSGNVCAIDETIRHTRNNILAAVSLLGPIAAIAFSILLATKVSAPAAIVAVVSVLPGSVLTAAIITGLFLSCFLPCFFLINKDEELTEKAINQEAVAQYQR